MNKGKLSWSLRIRNQIPAKKIDCRKIMKYEKWSLGYSILRSYVRFVDFFIHREVILNNRDNVPANTPVIFAPNHQNALSDPMAILLHIKQQPVWLARADIFKNKFTAAVLRFLKIMPVYRLRDGKEQLANNDKTFADSITVLKHNVPLALFPEAAHSGKRQMLAHKKAVPRIVFMAEEKAEVNLNIHIVPIGIYYSSYWKFDRTVIVNFGKPLKVNDYLGKYQENQNAATQLLKDDLFDAIEPLTINIRSKEHYHDIEVIREFYGKEHLRRQGKMYSANALFKSDQKLVKDIDELLESKPEVFRDLISKVNLYKRILEEYGLRSWLVAHPENNVPKIFLNKLMLLLGLPVFLFGFTFNALPFFFIDWFTRKKVKDHAFRSTFFLVLGLFLFPIVYLLELWALSGFVPTIWLKLLFLLSLPFAGKLAFRWYVLFLKTMGRIRLLYLRLFKKRIYEELQLNKNAVFDLLEAILQK